MASGQRAAAAGWLRGDGAFGWSARGEPSSPTIGPWMSFIASPTPRNWYRAHNASVVSAYLENRDLAEVESAARALLSQRRVASRSLRTCAGRCAASGSGAVRGAGNDPGGSPARDGWSVSVSSPRASGSLSRRGELLSDISRREQCRAMLDYGVIAPRLQKVCMSGLRGSSASRACASWCVTAAPSMPGHTTIGTSGAQRASRCRCASSRLRPPDARRNDRWLGIVSVLRLRESLTPHSHHST